MIYAQSGEGSAQRSSKLNAGILAATRSASDVDRTVEGVGCLFDLDNEQPAREPRQELTIIKNVMIFICRPDEFL
jgi:hypothetical protein